VAIISLSVLFAANIFALNEGLLFLKRKKSENAFSPKWLNRKTNDTIRKCSSKAFQ
jgi:hypothetical protein